MNISPASGPTRWATAFGLIVLLAAGTTLALRGADHADAPDTSEGNLDVNDLYVFARGDNLVFAMTVHPLLTPGEATDDAAFNPMGLYQFKLDRERDGIPDAVIQVAFAGNGPGQVVSIRGPVAIPAGSSPEMLVQAPTLRGRLDTTLGGHGMTAFAGRRDDPFFIDLFGDRSLTSVLNAAFSAALGEQVGADDEQTLAFDPNAIDDLAGLNTLAIVVEVPKADVAAALGIGSDDAFFAWATTSIRS